MENTPTVSVIIPTTCARARADFLFRSIRSVVHQRGVNVETILVCNGADQDLELAATLKDEGDIRIISLAEGNVSKARHEGLRMSTGAYFGFLDDDDEYLPDGLMHRVEAMQRHPDCDVVVTNGFLAHDDTREPLVPPSLAPRINIDPCGSFLESNWFASPAALFRRSSVDDDCFKMDLKYFEWTYLLFLLVSKNTKFLFDETMTYLKTEHEQSISRSDDYQLAYSDFLRTLKALSLPQNVHAAIHRKYVSALNAKSDFFRQRGAFAAAWKAHVSCLLNGGFAYLPYTRHLLLRSRK